MGRWFDNCICRGFLYLPVQQLVLCLLERVLNQKKQWSDPVPVLWHCKSRTSLQTRCLFFSMFCREKCSERMVVEKLHLNWRFVLWDFVQGIAWICSHTVGCWPQILLFWITGSSLFAMGQGHYVQRTIIQSQYVGWNGVERVWYLFSNENHSHTPWDSALCCLFLSDSIFTWATLIHHCENIEHAGHIERTRQQRTRLNDFKMVYFKSHMPASLIILISLFSTSALGCWEAGWGFEISE